MTTPTRSRLLIGSSLYLLSCVVVVVVLILVPDPYDRWVRAVLAIGALIADLWFMFRYHFGTRGYWRKSDIGVHLMSFGLANAVVLAHVVLAFFGLIPLAALPFLGALTYLTIGWLFGWRAALLHDYLKENGAK